MAPKAKTKCARPRRAKAVSRSKKECQKAKVIEDLAVESSWKSDSRHLGKAQAGGAGAAKARKRRATESVAVSTWCGFVCQMKRRIVRCLNALSWGSCQMQPRSTGQPRNIWQCCVGMRSASHYRILQDKSME